METVFLLLALVGVAALVRLYHNRRGRFPADSLGIVGQHELQFDACRVWLQHHADRAQPIEMICGPIPAGFDNDERVLCVLPAIDLLEPRAVRRSVRSGSSRSHGSAIRIARGLSFRVGAGSSTGISASESFDELRHIDHGTLVLTTKRLAFLGELRTNSTELDDLIGVHAFADSIRVHRERKQKAEHYQLSRMLEIPTEIGVLTVVGPMIQKAIELAKLNQEIIALETAWASSAVAKQSTRRTLL
jgi:hypothetical protein